MQRQDLERMTREQLIAQAERLGIPRPRVLTAPELIDEIIGRTATSERERTKARGWLGRARDLLAKVVEKGLHLPEAARALRQEDKDWPAPPPPLATVTLAEIYAAQGHYERAIAVLDEVLGREPDHREARNLRARFVEQLQRARARSGRADVPPPPPPPPPRAAKHVKESPVTKESPSSPTPAPEAQPAAEALPVPDAAEPTTENPPVAEAAAEPTSASVGGVTSEEAAASPPVAEAAAEPTTERPPVVEAAAEPTTETPPVVEAAAEAPALVEPPLPQRYEVDEVVAMAVDPGTIYLYWEVRATTLARARAAHPEGQLCVRIASVTASWDGPVIDTRDMRVDALYGDRFIRDVQPGSNVRVSVGWKYADGFEPLAVGPEVSTPRAVPVESVSQEVGTWVDQATVAPFAEWRPDTVPPAPEPRASEPLAARPAFGAPAVWATFPGTAAAGGPIDTGVAIWTEPSDDAGGTPPREEIVREEIVTVDAPWFIRGGASELSRGGPGRVHVRTVELRRLVPGAPGPGGRRGGASELGRVGGASELGR